jgi:hypothetical protein
MTVLLSKDGWLTTETVPHDAQFGQTGVDSDWYPGRRFPYGNQLFIYNVEHQYLKTLPSKEAADRYIKTMHPAGESGCPMAGGWDTTMLF